MYKIIKFITLLFFMSTAAWANLPYYPVEFPRDEAAHYENPLYPVSTMTEWWYYNGKLISKTGRKFGYYVSFNYMQIEEKGKKILIPMLQIQLTDIDKQKVYGKTSFFINKNDFSISTQKLDVTFGKNQLSQNNNTTLLNSSVVTDDGVPLNVSLEFTPQRDALLLNKTGLVYYKDKTNSYYYSYTQLNTKGHIQIDNEVFEIDPQVSLSWMDHQWGDFVMLPGRNQWIWGSVQLENGLEINLNVIFNAKTKEAADGNANIVMPDNSRIFITDIKEYTYMPRALQPGHKHPLIYDLSIPSLDLKLTLTAVAPGQDVNGIWEGISDVVGTYKGKPIVGQANTENTVVY